MFERYSTIRRLLSVVNGVHVSAGEVYHVQQLKDSLRPSVCMHVASSSLNVQRLTAKHIGPWSRDARNKATGFPTRPFFHAYLVKLKLLIIIRITKGARIFRLKALKPVIYLYT